MGRSIERAHGAFRRCCDPPAQWCCPGAGSRAGSGWRTPGIAGCHSSVTGGGKVLWAPPDGPSQRLRWEWGPVTTLGTEKPSPPPT